MKKHQIILVFIFLLLTEAMTAQTLIWTKPNDFFVSYPSFVIDDISVVDSINNVIDSVKKTMPAIYPWERVEDVRESEIAKMYAAIDFVNMSEAQINSAIHKIRNRDEFHNIGFSKCNLHRLPDSVIVFDRLSRLGFSNCDSINDFGIFNSAKSILELWFINCKITRLPKGANSLKPMLYLRIKTPEDFKDFDLNMELSKFVRRNNILNLLVEQNCLEKFPDTLFSLTALQTLGLSFHKNCNYPLRFNELVNLQNLIYASSFEIRDHVWENCSSNGILNNYKTEERGSFPLLGLFEDPSVEHSFIYKWVHHLTIDKGKNIFYDYLDTNKIISKKIQIGEQTFSWHISLEKIASLSPIGVVDASDSIRVIFKKGTDTISQSIIDNKGIEYNLNDLSIGYYDLVVIVNNEQSAFRITIK